MRRHSLSALHRTVLPLAALALLGLLVAGCEIAKPELPRYQTRLALPLGEERLDIAEAIEDEDYLIELPDGGLGFEVEGDPELVALDLDLAADIDPQSVTGDLGNFSLDLGNPPSFDFVLSDLYPAATGLDGMTVPVPPFGFTTESSPEDLEDIDAATLAAGTLTVTVDNGLPVPVSALSGPDRLVLELIDPGTGLALVTVEFDPIPAFGQAIEAADLAGVVLPGAVAVRLVGGSPGSSGSPVLVDAAAAIAVGAEFTDLEVTAAQAVVGPQTFQTSFGTDLPADYEVERAIIGSGAMQVSVQNQMPIPCTAVVTWPTVVDLDGNPMQAVIPLAGGASDVRGLDFAGYILRAPAGTVLTDITATVDVTSPGSGGAAVAMDMTMGLRADLSAGRIEFTSVTGVVPETVFDLDPMEEEIDLPDELNGVSLTRASLVLDLTNSAGIDAAADIVLTGTNGSGVQRTMTVSEPIAAADAGRATVTSIVMDETNSTIVDFLNNLPTSITLAGSVQLGGNGQVGTVRADDSAEISWRIVAPVEVIIASSHLYGDADPLDLDTDTRDLIADHLGAAELQLEVFNHLPVGIETRLLFGLDEETVKTSPLLAIGPLTVDAGETDPVTHEVVTPRTSQPLLSLTAEQTQLLATEGLLSVLEVVLPSTDGQTVRVLTTDYVTIQGLIYVEVDVHDGND